MVVDDALLDVVDRALNRLGAQPLGGALDDEALHDSVRRLARCEARVAAEKLRRIGAVAERESFRADAQRSAADWLAANGFTVRTNPASWQAVFGFYTPTLRTPGPIASPGAGHPVDVFNVLY